jgi:hypothetical protein
LPPHSAKRSRNITVQPYFHKKIQLIPHVVSEYSKRWLRWKWMMQKALVSRSVQRQIICHYSIYWQHPTPIQGVQKAEVDEERLFTG